jgi:hypothetical protein
VHALASIVAATAAMNALPLGACHSRSERQSAGAGSPKDEVWLSDDDVRRLQVVTEAVTLQDVDETLITVGPVVSAAECPVKTPPEERKACVVVTVEQGALGRIQVRSTATARTSKLVHDAFPGQVAWIAGALDSSGRTVKLGCLFADTMAELRAGQQVRVELVVGARPAFAVSRTAVLETRDGTFVFTSKGTAQDGRHMFARVPVSADRDTGGPWLPVTNLQPGSIVVRSGAQALASMLAVTTL